MEGPDKNQGRIPRKPNKSLFGVYRAHVVNNVDPENQGRVMVRFPSSVISRAGMEEVWARLVTWMSGDRSGAWFVPDVGNEVLIAFEGGDSRYPYLIGSLWNDADRPPDEENNRKTIRTRRGVQITIEDTEGAAALTLKTPQSQTVVLNDADNSVLVMDSSGNTIELDSSGISITAGARVKITAGTLEIDTGMLKVNAALSEFSGLVKCDTLMANSVISSSYTPGG